MEKASDEALPDDRCTSASEIVHSRQKKNKKRKKVKMHKKAEAAAVNIFSGILHNCKHCNRFFPSQTRLREHTKQTHATFRNNSEDLAETSSEYNCKQCRHYFASEMQLQKHVTNQICGTEPEELNVCLQTEKKSKTKSASRVIVQEKGNGYDFECTACNLFFSSKVTLSEHQLKLHMCEVVVDCPCCSTQIRTPNPNVRSIETQTHTFQNCRMCDDKFENLQDLQWHLLRRHKIEPALVRISCAKRCGRPPNTNGHFLCKVCSKPFKSKQAVKNHQYTHAAVPDTDRRNGSTHDDPSCFCFQCKRMFDSDKDLKVHLLQHSESRQQQKNWICHKCGQTYGRKSHLNVHMKRHAGIRSFSCEHCEKCFYTSHNLKEHLLTHTGEKPYFCTIQGCLKRFTQKSHLKYHLKSHSRKTAQSKVWQQKEAANQVTQESNDKCQGEHGTVMEQPDIHVVDNSHVEEAIKEEVVVGTTPHTVVEVHQGEGERIQYMPVDSQPQDAQEVNSLSRMEHQPVSIFIAEIHSYSEQVI